MQTYLEFLVDSIPILQSSFSWLWSCSISYLSLSLFAFIFSIILNLNITNITTLEAGGLHETYSIHNVTLPDLLFHYEPWLNELIQPVIVFLGSGWHSLPCHRRHGYQRWDQSENSWNPQWRHHDSGSNKLFSTCKQVNTL